MKRLMLIAWAIALAVLPTGHAGAGTTALVSFHGTGNGAWERRLQIQDLLRSGFDFDEVTVLVDTTPKEVPKQVRKFLESPLRDGDKRFVWISGAGKSICPGNATAPIQPRAPSLILAPGCYISAVRFPQGARHYGLTTPEPIRAAARVGRIDSRDPAWVSLLALPSSEDRHIEGADMLLLESLKAGRDHGIIDPSALLHALRAGFRWNDSRYTPTLNLFHQGTETDALAPFGFLPKQKASDRLDRIRPVTLRKARLNLHETPRAHLGPALSIRKSEPVRVLRADPSGGMRFVAVGEKIFGWVRRDDLRL